MSEHPSMVATPHRLSRIASSRRTLILTTLATGITIVVLVAPLYLDEFWLRLGFTICGAAIGALGLNILTGAAGQLSLAHAFFLGIGAFAYCYFAGEANPATGLGGLGLPPIGAMVLAMLLAAFVGFLISPVSSRLGGLNLGVATLALVFVGQYLLNTLTPVTGGFLGRSAPRFDPLGFAGDAPVILGVPFGRFEQLWYLGVVLLFICAVVVRNLLANGPGRAFRMIRDKELAAAVIGIQVRRWKQHAFVISSGLAGLSGVLFALAIGSVAPESFTLELSIQYLVMIVIGGLATVGGSIAGAAFVVSLPLLLQQYSAHLPFLNDQLTPADAARYIYAGVLILVLMFAPGGIASLWSRRTTRRSLMGLVRLRSNGAGAPTALPSSQAGPDHQNDREVEHS
ncbi:branched-chain amino acid ABC transporter permease [Okibacterium endophyticum]